MKKIFTIAAIAALTTLAACDEPVAPVTGTEPEISVPDQSGSDELVEDGINPKELSEDNPAQRPQ